MIHLESNRLGIVAGWGSFPVELGQAATEQGRELYVVALKQHADQRLEAIAQDIRWMGVLKIGSHLKYFAKHGIRQVAFAGKIFKHRILYSGWGWIEHVPDLCCTRVLGKSFLTRARDQRDDTILSSVVGEYERWGMEVLPITHLAPNLLVEEGILTRNRPSKRVQLDAQFGWKIALAMGGLDIGQSITVKDQLVLGVEAIEGTDALIARTAALCPRGGFTLIKVAKPNQDMRFDVPTIGRKTIEQMHRAGGKSIVVQAGRTILVDRQETLRLAQEKGISISSMVNADACKTQWENSAVVAADARRAA